MAGPVTSEARLDPSSEAVTFLFTDIVGSTRLWERSPAAMRTALRDHDDIVRRAVEKAGGRVFKYVGDAVYAAFASADDALRAALAAQQALQAEEWPEDAPIRVRMAVHTGPAERLDDDFIGPTLNRCARLLDLAHGGQLLVSGETRRRLGPLPEGVALEDLAAHRLRDLTMAERVYQVTHPSLAADFPPLRSTDTLPTNLPVRRSPFVGRDGEVAELRRLLTSASLVTLTGCGGCGKSRLALQVAAEMVDRFADGVWLAGLASLSEPDLVAQRVAGALGLAEEPARALVETIADYLRPRQVMLVLDDCEHVVDECASLCHDLLAACPELVVLVTSREALDVEGEVVWEVPPLSSPDPADLADMPDDRVAEMVGEFDAVRLFALRASVAAPGFELTPANARDVGAICWRLDGIPLAVELAAARVRVMSVEHILERLDDRFDLLTDGRRDVLPRQQTLRALIDWSYDLLSADERALLVRLSVFRGGWTLAAAEESCSGNGVDRREVLDLLTALVAKSMVRVRDGAGGVRYEFLHTIQDYAWQRFATSDEFVAVHRRFVSWVRELVAEVAPRLAGPDQASVLERLDAERDNLRAALAWTTRRAGASGDPEAAEAALSLAAEIVPYWELRGRLREARARVTAALEAAGLGVPARIRAAALIGAGRLAAVQADFPEARQRATAALLEYRELEDRAGIASAMALLARAATLEADYPSAREYGAAALALHEHLADDAGIADDLFLLGSLEWEQGDPDAAESALGRSLEMRRQLGDRRAVAQALNALAAVAYNRGDVGSARRMFDESLAALRDLGDPRGVALVLGNLGHLAVVEGETDSARAFLEESLELRRQTGDRRGEAGTLRNLGDLAAAVGDIELASAHYRASLDLRRAIGDSVGIAESLEALASVLLAGDRPARAAYLIGAAAAIRREIGAPPKAYERAEHERRLSAARQALGEGDFAAAWAGGREAPWTRAVALALGEEDWPP